jgi:hypothetical protein
MYKQASGRRIHVGGESMMEEESMVHKQWLKTKQRHVHSAEQCVHQDLANRASSCHFLDGVAATFAAQQLLQEIGCKIGLQC